HWLTFQLLIKDTLTGNIKVIAIDQAKSILFAHGTFYLLSLWLSMNNRSHDTPDFKLGIFFDFNRLIIRIFRNQPDFSLFLLQAFYSDFTINYRNNYVTVHRCLGAVYHQ